MVVDNSGVEVRVVVVIDSCVTEVEGVVSVDDSTIEILVFVSTAEVDCIEVKFVVVAVESWVEMSVKFVVWYIAVEVRRVVVVDVFNIKVVGGSGVEMSV